MRRTGLDAHSGTRDRWYERTPLSVWLFIAAVFVALQALKLAVDGLPLICTCNSIEWWHGNPSGPETSQHLTDWYTYTHVLHGFGFYLLLWLIVPGLPLGARFAIAVGLEAVWEVAENMPFIMERYRQSALARGYFGDSILNSVSDTLAAALGFVVARALPAWTTAALLVGLELFAAVMIRDNLTLNVIQLVHPTEAISRWQAGE